VSVTGSVAKQNHLIDGVVVLEEKLMRKIYETGKE
jgi:hypothetical protein